MILVLTVEFAWRVLLGAVGTGAIGVAVFWGEEFRWGKRRPGPRIEPQWFGRLFFGFIGAVMLYAAIKGFR